MNEIKEISVYESIRESYVNYGLYVNNHRHIPYLLDGLKPVYKKVILTLLKKTGMEKTIALAGACAQYYHDHGDSSISPVISQLVRIGIFDGEGNHGCPQLLGEDVEEAAPRYSQAGLNPGYGELFRALIDYVPTFQNSFGTAESEYIPFPLPLVCTFGGLGIGIGTGSKLPAFTPRSILKAYKNDDPELLESKYGYSILNKDELRKIWTIGRGYLKLKMKVIRDNDGGTIIEGNPTEFKPEFKQLMRWRDERKCIIQDLSSDVPRIKFSKVYRLKFPTNEDIYNQVERESVANVPYYLRTTYKEKVYTIGLRDWVDITYNNYKTLLEKRRLDKIDKCNKEILVYFNFKPVAELILNNKMPDDKIAKKLKISPEIVSTISNKSIKTLRDLDADKMVDKYKKELEQLSIYNHDKYIDDIINKL